MKNQREIIEEIGRVQIEIESINQKPCACRCFNCSHQVEIEAAVSKHKCLLAYRNALTWVLDFKLKDQAP